MLPQNFWADLAGGLLTTIFDTFMALLLTPLSALTDGLLNFFASFLP